MAVGPFSATTTFPATSFLSPTPSSARSSERSSASPSATAASARSRTNSTPLATAPRPASSPARRATRQVGGNRFSYDAIKGVVENPVYKGLIRHQDQVYPGEHEALITGEGLGRGQRRPARYKPRRKMVGRTPKDDHVHLLNGLSECGDCGSTMTPYPAGKKSPEGQPYLYYTCTQVIEWGSTAIAGSAASRPQVRAGRQMTRSPTWVKTRSWRSAFARPTSRPTPGSRRCTRDGSYRGARAADEGDQAVSSRFSRRPTARRLT